MHIGIVIWALFISRGGLENFGVKLAEEMVRRGYRITVFHAEQTKTEQLPVYPISTEIKLVGLPRDRRSPHTSTKIRTILVESELDVLTTLFSWDDLLRFPVALNGTEIPLLVSEHSSPQAIEQEIWNESEHRACLEAADQIHILLPSFLSGYPRYLHEKITIIPNPVAKADYISAEMREKSKRKILLAAGRFDDKVKQFSLLIKGFALLHHEFPDWEFVLCGDGPDKALYEKLIVSLGLEGYVTMPGMINDMGAYYSKSHLFCIPSRYEGFGLVTVEAQSYGLPVVGFSQCSGTNDIISHKENGLLADKMTAECLMESLSFLMKDQSLRLKMGERGQEMLSRYDEKLIYDQWEKLLTNMSKLKKRVPICGNDDDQILAQHTLEEILSRKTPFKRKRPLSEEIKRIFNRLILAKYTTLKKDK